MKWRYYGERRRLFGAWRYPGDIIEHNAKPSGLWKQVSKDNKIIERINDKIGQDKESISIKKLRIKLSNEKMKEVRKIGKKYDVYDTKKSELIDEIINAKIKKGEL